MKDVPSLKVGELVSIGQKIGRMGTSGQSTAAHLHIDCVEGEQKTRFHLADIDIKKIIAVPRQLNLFIDRGIFNIDPEITTYYADPGYQEVYKKVHYGYDVVPEDRKTTDAHFDIHWNRTIAGKVCFVDYDEAGYGNCIYISFDA